MLHYGRRACRSQRQKISLESLSALTGLPLELIKRELLIEDNEISLESLRRFMLCYLKKIDRELKDLPDTSSVSSPLIQEK